MVLGKLRVGRPGSGHHALPLLAVLVLLAAPGTARADWPSGRNVRKAAVLLALPHEVGALVISGEARPALGWSLQIPLDVEQSPMHRIVPEIGWNPMSERRVRGRLAWRLGGHWWLAGVGGTVDRQGFSWSPEVGVRFLHEHEDDGDANPSAHVIVRADLSPVPKELVGCTFLVGWGLY